ncbi:hypothetical protein LTR17_020466 [Elasticomyces elasticus]|nr:hypothetical protein LTR17_020466 [Elasticomyces elasticus]
MAERLPTYLEARFAAIGNQLEHNEWLSSELDTIDESIESTRRELRVQHNELMQVLRDITMEALGMHDVLLGARYESAETVAINGPYELDSSQSTKITRTDLTTTTTPQIGNGSASATAELPCVTTETLVRADSACANPKNHKGAELDTGTTGSTNSLRNSGAADQPDPGTTSARHSKSTAVGKAPVTIKRLRETVKPPFFRPNGVSMY